ncbi:helix-turn-helix transcriptional regulator [Bosea sp. 2RAB26]|uniref:helix-turn-helix transcriptional regulator n=1 Tax=Bosea sp. 2RAB26 TaxID=3237476 RepID=UPI003F9065E1
MSSTRPLDRREASRYLFDRYGIRRAPGTLAKLACIGGGPLYRHAGQLAIYDVPALDEYAAQLTTAPAPNSKAHAARRAASGGGR